LADARSDLRKLFQERERLERRIVQTRQSVIALQRMIEGVVPIGDGMNSIGDRNVGLTEAVRLVLEAAAGPLEPTGVRNKLETVGYDIGSSPHVLNNVHTVLGRLAKSGQVKQIARRIIGKSKTAKKAIANGARFNAIAYLWGGYAIPKGWTTYPDKRLQKQWDADDKAASSDETES
jgi:hypothetical protein